MNDSLRREPPGKGLLRAGWRAAQTAGVLASTLTAGRRGPIRLFYGGAHGGDLGGPQVKIKRLSEFFPTSRWQYNVAYLLSNAPYLSAVAIDWLKMRRIPVVLNQNGVFYPGWFGGDWRKMNGFMATAYHRADYVFWQSDFCRRAADRFLGRREGPGGILFNAIDTQHRFRPAGVHPDHPFTFLLTGRIDAHMAYRVESSIAGLRAARDAGLDCRLLVAGWIADSALTASRQLADRLALSAQVDFCGPYTQATAPAIYQSADAYVMTKYLDPCPNTVLEAMACGLPVLYSASGGVPEQVGPEAGIGLAVPESWDDTMHTPSPEAIGAGMVEVARLSKAMGLAARRRAEAEFEITHWIDRHREVFRQLLDTRR
ncbi:MAG: hypothetical protein A2286_10595 [Gammaproteobacteria bacterium RIFOXYA12_FULL_61_12]|nr:MAG: hypothetical protein A2514_14835 [Gammaproteobacteria bacterium RIFOXYD12_FULL_61_37]OGT93508.1 MAG: hypothetical protein A2286_10595 [Gammaproteobacteria bacterium RIFOXYA12_FULL_61_12]